MVGGVRFICVGFFFKMENNDRGVRFLFIRVFRKDVILLILMGI